MFIWTLSDAIYLLAALLFGVVGLRFYLPVAFKQWRCKHDGDFRETMQCDAICNKCNKNLGFIGAWRNKTKQK